MDNPKALTIVTNGDAQIHTISTISELKHLVLCMFESIIYLNIYVAEHVTETKHKNIIKSHVSLIIPFTLFYVWQNEIPCNTTRR